MHAPAAPRRRRAVLVTGAAIVAGIAAAMLYFRSEPAAPDRRADAARMMNELMSGKAAIGGPFTLTDPQGRRRSLADFRGRIVLLYFGYTFCPDVCPTDLAAIARLLGLLGADAAQVQPIFVTLDPERDTAEVLRDYAAAFDLRILALRGSEDEVRRVASAYKVFFEKVTPPGSSTYVVDHMAFTFLLDREGRYVAFFPPGTPGDRMATMVGELLHPARS